MAQGSSVKLVLWICFLKSAGTNLNSNLALNTDGGLSLEETEFVAVLNEPELSEGTMKAVSVNGTPVLLIKKDGKIYAVDDRCPHMQCRLSRGKLEGLFVVCPCHDWRFNLETGEYEEEPAFKLTSFKCKIEDDKIWVKMEE